MENNPYHLSSKAHMSDKAPDSNTFQFLLLQEYSVG